MFSSNVCFLSNHLNFYPYLLFLCKLANAIQLNWAICTFYCMYMYILLYATRKTHPHRGRHTHTYFSLGCEVLNIFINLWMVVELWGFWISWLKQTENVELNRLCDIRNPLSSFPKAFFSISHWQCRGQTQTLSLSWALCSPVMYPLRKQLPRSAVLKLINVPYPLCSCFHF